MALLYRNTIGSQSGPRDPDEGSARKALPEDPVELALMCPCPLCWANPGTRCTIGVRRPGNHLGRYMRANRRGLVSNETLGVILKGVGDPEDPAVMILDDFVERPEQ